MSEKMTADRPALEAAQRILDYWGPDYGNEDEVIVAEALLSAAKEGPPKALKIDMDETWTGQWQVYAMYETEEDADRARAALLPAGEKTTEEREDGQPRHSG